MFEINLVPELKDKAIKAIKLRNLIFFGCIVVVAASVAILIVLGVIKGGQDLALANKDDQLSKFSSKIQSFEDLDELLTIQSQLSGINSLNSNKKVLSRIFNVLQTLLPTNGDEITISELSVNLDESTISFDAQARAKTEPFINYNVLNAFKQSMGLMRYDYGRYVDKNGNQIPTLCIQEQDVNGTISAIWAQGATGCDPSNNEDGLTASNEEAQKIFAAANAEPELKEKTREVEVTDEDEDDEEDSDEDDEEVNYLEGLENPGSTVIKEEKKKTKQEVIWTTIYRTPLFNEWYNKGYMSLDGQISGVQHFETSCYTYTGIDDGKNEKNEDGTEKLSAKWTMDNSCEMVPEDINIIDSSDGRDSEGELVLRFSAVININSEVFAFRNKHMLTIAPTGKTNVTDSYIQVEGMFDKKAEACYDAECKTSYQEDL